MRPWMSRATLRGRLHGRLLLVLVVVTVLASATAAWQFIALRDDPDPGLAVIEGLGTPAVPGPADDPDSSSASASATPSPTVASSPIGDDTASAEAIASESASEEAAGGPECTASLTLDSEWAESISVTVTVANTGTDPVEGWEVLLALEHLTVTTTWGLDHIEGDRYGDVLFNAAVSPGGSVEPSFQADVEGEYALPATVPCTPE